MMAAACLQEGSDSVTCVPNGQWVILQHADLLTATRMLMHLQGCKLVDSNFIYGPADANVQMTTAQGWRSSKHLHS